MKKVSYLVSALVLTLGLTASQTSFAEFFPPPVMPIGGCLSCSIPAYGLGGHGFYSPGYGFGYRPYGLYRHGYGYWARRRFLARGGCGSPWMWRHRFACGRGRRSFRSFSLNIGFGGFGLSLNTLRF